MPVDLRNWGRVLHGVIELSDLYSSVVQNMRCQSTLDYLVQRFSNYLHSTKSDTILLYPPRGSTTTATDVAPATASSFPLGFSEIWWMSKSTAGV
jgi:hypothetical protein